AQDLPAGARLPDWSGGARLTLPDTLEIDVGTGSLREGARGQQDMRYLAQRLTREWRDGHDDFRLPESSCGIGFRRIDPRLEATDEKIGLQRPIQHVGRRQAGGARRLATGLAVRHGARKIGPGGIRALCEHTE